KSSLRYSPRQFQATPDIFTCDNKHLSSRLVHHANLPAPAAALILRLFYTSSGLIMTAGFRNTSVGTSWYAMTARLGKERIMVWRRGRRRLASVSRATSLPAVLPLPHSLAGRTLSFSRRDGSRARVLTSSARRSSSSWRGSSTSADRRP